jgi:hypothetical protein
VDARHGGADLAPGKTLSARRLIVAHRGPRHAAVALALAAAQIALRSVRVAPTAWLPGATLLIERDGRPWLITPLRPASRARPREPLALQLPAEAQPRYRLRMHVPGVGVGPAAEVPAPTKLGTPVPTVAVEPPPAGELLVEIEDEQHRFLPAKLIWQGHGGTPTPDLGRERNLRADHVVYTAGRSDLLLAPGTYALTVTRGPDYELAVRRVQIKAAQTQQLKLVLRKLVTTPGWIAADLHVHSNASYDSPVTPAARIIAAAAVGVELLATTDHNAVAHYARALSRGTYGTAARELLGQRLQLIAGDEVSTERPGFGHFNAFPLTSDVPPAHRGTDAPRLFRETRAAGRDVLIQVNHPRMGSIGYFDQLGFDPLAGRASRPRFAAGFDLLEVFNGDHLEHPAEVARCLADWHALLRTGQRVTATGGSDAHRLPVQDAGYPRTLVLWQPGARDDEDSRAARTSDVLAALRGQRAVVSSGPFIELLAEGQPVGALVKARGGQVELSIAVQAAPHVDVREVELLDGGTLRERFTVAGRAVRRFARRLTLPVRGDTWLVALARGQRADPTQRAGVHPFALTNPIFVDADGDGRFTPPRTRAGQPEERKP